MSRKNKNAAYRGKNLKKQTHARCCAERRFERFVKKFFEEKKDGGADDGRSR